jgi:hypothetical protein
VLVFAQAAAAAAIAAAAAVAAAVAAAGLCKWLLLCIACMHTCSDMLSIALPAGNLLQPGLQHLLVCCTCWDVVIHT